MQKTCTGIAIYNIIVSINNSITATIYNKTDHFPEQDFHYL